MRPRDLCKQLLEAQLAAEGRMHQRKRDQRPDRVGLSLRRALLEQAVADDPDPAGFEGWLMERVYAAVAGGPLRSVAEQILDEYRFASADPRFEQWLAMGAPSADARPEQRDRGRADEAVDPSSYCPICQTPHLRGV